MRRGSFRDLNNLHYIHIGKTGGSALRRVIEKYPQTDRYKIHYYPHGGRFRGIPEGEKLLITTRDPVTRFVSGFNSRLRRGRPLYDGGWTPNERIVFSNFETPNALAKALYSSNDDERQTAEFAMDVISHLTKRSSFKGYFTSPEYVRSRADDILAVMQMETFDEDFERVKKLIGWPPEAELTKDKVLMHATPRGFNTQLEEDEAENVRRWYAEDYEILEELYKL